MTDNQLRPSLEAFSVSRLRSVSPRLCRMASCCDSQSSAHRIRWGTGVGGSSGEERGPRLSRRVSEASADSQGGPLGHASA